MEADPPIRQATRNDLPEIMRIVNLAYQVEAFFKVGNRIELDQLQARYASAGACFLVIDGPDAGRLVATVFFDHRGDHAWFGLLAVDPAAQGRGHARALILALEDRCRILGLPRLELDIVNLRTELPGFYAHLGFVATGWREFPSSEQLVQPVRLVVMEKAVGSSQPT